MFNFTESIKYKIGYANLHLLDKPTCPTKISIPEQGPDIRSMDSNQLHLAAQEAVQKLRPTII
jgi:hypothetical protein